MERLCHESINIPQRKKSNCDTFSRAMKEENVIADVNEDASEKIANELNVKKLKFLIIGGHQLMSSYFKCIYNPKLNGTIFSVWNKKMREEKFENPTPVIEEMIQGNYIKYFIMKFSLFPILLK
ncbi:hypothetical protein RhiirA5_401764 [Rhizophagus irregularis]|uniref:Uncharacterized protein n=1 Tax=Rhizophagus irregularis TaxID=588596 RepID=A0A2N0PAC5_9GLOM|nr:hypothetical protein RhiirA5_404044 [Rhizophagus irregularis]PKC03772.1 hypothetical protein RhiirA5_401764 [Rhizophagus irregularis]PKC72253.1 hypothetical protein RhiirA1_438373 [Rhizophagus irregularis]GET61190.1 hypothetical protein GLOIN_2v1779794 [Rhizophagus irregularis DAOM 181602=DAOM 197198]